jgi:hypothetical protein
MSVCVPRVPAGAIILADARFAQPATQRNLSRWVRASAPPCAHAPATPASPSGLHTRTHLVHGTTQRCTRPRAAFTPSHATHVCHATSIRQTSARHTFVRRSHVRTGPRQDRGVRPVWPRHGVANQVLQGALTCSEACFSMLTCDSQSCARKPRPRKPPHQPSTAAHTPADASRRLGGRGT